MKDSEHGEEKVVTFPVDYTNASVEAMRALFAAAGGGGGDMTGLEPRLAVVETEVRHISSNVSELKGDMKDVRDRTTRIEEKISHLPSKEWSVSIAVFVITCIGAFVTFQERIQEFVGMTN